MTNIFRDDQDKTRFLDRLGQAVQEGKCAVYAWALMDNHVHLLFKIGKQASPPYRDLYGGREKAEAPAEVKRSGRTITDIVREECKRNNVSAEELARGNRRIRVSETRLTIAQEQKRAWPVGS